MVVSHPDTVVHMSELKDMVDERLGLGVVFRHVEGRNKGFLNQFKVGLAVKFGVEGQKWSGALQTVACHFELVGVMHVLDTEFGDWSLYSPDI